MSIMFGTQIFTEPELLAYWSPPRLSALYVVLAEDSSCSPRPMRPLYFGESDNLADRGFSSHHARHEWLREAAGAPLWIAYSPTPYWTEAERRAAEDALVRHYTPACNGRSFGADALTDLLTWTPPAVLLQAAGRRTLR